MTAVSESLQAQVIPSNLLTLNFATLMATTKVPSGRDYVPNTEKMCLTSLRDP